MSRCHRRLDAGFGALVVVLGSWAFYAQLCVLAQLSFETLRTFSFLPLLFAAAVVWGTASKAGFGEDRNATVARTGHPRWPGEGPMIGAPIAIAVLYALTGVDWLLWVLAACYLTAVVWFGPRVGSSPDGQDAFESPREWLALLALGALAALLASGTIRPDPDDAYFLSAAAAAIGFPEAALQSFDALHRSGLPPVEELQHLPQIYEIGVALLADVTGRSIHSLYYVVLPPLWALLGTLAHWFVLRHFLDRNQALWGTVFFVFLLVFWGDGHRTFGNFGFVRLFQGKAIHLTLLLPLVVHAALRYRERPGAATWLRLALSQCAAAGLTTNALVVAPLAAALAVVASPRFDRRFLRMAGVGIAASLPLFIVAMGMFVRMAPYLSSLGTGSTRRDYSITLGDARAPLVLLAIMLLPLLATRVRSRHADWLVGYVWLVVLVILMPAFASLAGSLLGHVYGWRVVWAVPIPLLISLAGGIACGLATAKRGGAAILLALWVVAFAMAGPMAVSGEIFSFQNLGRPKAHRAALGVAREAVARADPDALMLAPESVAVYVTGLRGAPPLVGVRKLYLSKLSGFVPAEELENRTRLFRYVGGKARLLSVSEALREIDARSIGTVLFRASHPHRTELAPALEARGFVVDDVGRFVIAVRAAVEAPLPGADTGAR